MLKEVFLGKARVPETCWNLLNRFGYGPDPPTLVAKASLLYSLGVLGHRCCRRYEKPSSLDTGYLTTHYVFV